MQLKTKRTLTRSVNQVKIAALAASVILVLQGLHFYTFAQHSQVTQTANQSRDERVRQILESLEPGNTLRVALKRGDRGSGAHYAWMDKMQQQDIKQTSYRIRFRWGKQNKKLKITDVKYLRRYYRFDTAIDDQAIIEQIRVSGLEQELRTEILLRAKVNLEQRMQDLGSSQICGTLYLNLLADDVLPILDEPPILDNDCKVACR